MKARSILITALLLFSPLSAAHGQSDVQSKVATDTSADIATPLPDPTATQGPPELLKPVENPILGLLHLPPLWTPSEIPGGLRAVEERNPRPGAIEIVFVPLPNAIPAAELLHAFVQEVKAAHGPAQIDPAHAIDNNGLETHAVQILVEEQDTTIRYAVVVITGNKGAYIATLGVPQERFSDLDPEALLVNILNSVQAP